MRQIWYIYRSLELSKKRRHDFFCLDFYKYFWRRSFSSRGSGSWHVWSLVGPSAEYNINLDGDGGRSCRSWNMRKNRSQLRRTLPIIKQSFGRKNRYVKITKIGVFFRKDVIFRPAKYQFNINLKILILVKKKTSLVENFRFRQYTPYKRTDEKLDGRPIFEMDWTGESTVFRKKGCVFTVSMQKWTGDQKSRPSFYTGGGGVIVMSAKNHQIDHFVES